MRKEFWYILLGLTVMLFVGTFVYSSIHKRIIATKSFEDMKATNEFLRQKEQEQIEIAKEIQEIEAANLRSEQKTQDLRREIDNDNLELERYEKGLFTKFGIKPGYDGEGNCIDKEKCNSK